MRCPARLPVCSPILIIGVLAAAAAWAPQAAARQGDVVPVRVSLDTLYTIGTPKADPDELLASGRMGERILMDLGPDGHLWVLNPAGQHLLVFDRNGKRIRLFGRDGEGPGEFHHVMALTAVAGGAWTWDRKNQQLCRWSIADGLVSTTRTDLPQPFFNRAAVDRTGNLWYFSEDHDEPMLEVVPVNLRRWRPDTADPLIASFPIPGVSFPGSAATFSFTPHLTAAPVRGVLVAGESEYVVHQYDARDTEPVSIWRLPSTRTPYTDREKGPMGRGGITVAGGKKYEPPILDHKPDVLGLFSSASGDVWLQLAPRDLEAQAIRLDRLNADGRRTRAIWYPGRYVSSICSDGDLVWILGMTDEGMQIQCVRMTAVR